MEAADLPANNCGKSPKMAENESFQGFWPQKIIMFVKAVDKQVLKKALDTYKR